MVAKKLSATALSQHSPLRETDRITPLALARAAKSLLVCTSIAFTERLAAAGVSGSVGTVGDAYDNALAESVIGLFKTELIKPRGQCSSSSRPPGWDS
jgi:transposase InsO family protein